VVNRMWNAECYFARYTRMTTKLYKRLGFYFVEQVGSWEVKEIFRMVELRKLRKLFRQSAIGKEKKVI
jgi:hypothetical protein